MLRRLAIIAGLCAIALVGSLGRAVDSPGDPRTAPGVPFWPQWRGPHRNGISDDKDLLKGWTKDGPPLAWKCTGMGAGFSGVSIAAGRIFGMGDRDGAQWVFARELADGKEIWSSKIGDPWDPGGYSGPRCTPTIDGDLIYALGTNGNLMCLTAAKGDTVWSKSLPKEFEGRMHSGWGFSESPLVDGDRVVCTPGGPQAGMVALNKKTGEVIWKCAMPKLGDHGGDGAAYASIVISQGAGVKQYVQLMGRGVVGVAADDGRFLWGYNRVANGTANIPTPVVHEDYVFCSSGYGAGAALLKLKKSDSGVEAEEVYFLEAKDLQNHHGGMILLGDYIYCGHGHNKGAPTCIEWRTGKRMWRHDHGPGKDSSCVTYADGNLYFRFQDGTMALIAATPEDYQELGVFTIPNVSKPSWPHPVIAGGKLYLREQDTLLVYDIHRRTVKHPIAVTTRLAASKLNIAHTLAAYLAGLASSALAGSFSFESLSFGSNLRAAEFMQSRWPVGCGPSSNTCPRCEPQREQTTSSRTI